ncbi:MAG TPA: PstS family phosphate ABC transporter substrate-binding protein [Longimicrobiaceae bacterium]|nr:PstS family phosphate ABC transporter substrate-binding protein [Longimicrobiaceae bacterium]
MNGRLGVTALGVLAVVVAACGGDGSRTGRLSGTVQVDGSSTVFPVTEAVAEEFMAETGGSVRVTVALSGTGGGFRRFCSGETDLSNASRPISEDEIAACEAAGVRYRQFEVALDGLAIVVHPSNQFVECLTVEELRRIWEPGSTIRSWSEVRPEWPGDPIRLYGPGTNSGTFDYFTEVIGGEVGSSRADYTASEDDNVLVQGVSGDVNSLGYFGFAYYIENQDRVRIVPVDSGQGCVTPTPETIETGRYSPLSRPLYIYVNEESLADPAVHSFVEFYLNVVPELAGEVGYVPLSQQGYEQARAQLGPGPDA